jgi:hypothetical protein
LEVLVSASTKDEIIQLIDQSEANKIKILVEESQNVLVAKLLVLSVEKLAELNGDYTCRSAIIINDALEKLFLSSDNLQQFAFCKLFKFYYLKANSDFDTILSDINSVIEIFQLLGETYAKACTLLLKSECLLITSKDREQAIQSLFDAISIFKQDEDFKQLSICAQLQNKYKLNIT